MNFHSPWNGGNLSRRHTLPILAGGLFPLGIQDILAQTQTKIFRLTQKSDQNMPDGYGRWQVRRRINATPDDNRDPIVANFFTLENGGGSRVDLVSEGPIYNPNGGLDSRIRNKIPPGRKPVIVMAGPFFDAHNSVEGCCVQNGQIRNANFSNKFGGYTLLFPDGHIELGEVPKDEPGKQRLLKKATNNGATLFQQYILFPQEGNQKLNVTPNKFRFLVKRRSSDGSETFGVCAFMENISIEDALQVMREIGIEEAVYLDTNSVAKITCFDDKSKPFILGGSKDDPTKGTAHKNALVFTASK